MTKSSWHIVRWVPASILLLLGSVGALYRWTQGGPDGCVYFAISDFDTVDQVGRSWLPPSVTCRFTYYDDSVIIEHQPAWGYYLPVALLLGAGACALFAARHPLVGDVHPRSMSRHLERLLGYWFVVAVTLVGLMAMAWRDSSRYSIWPFVTVPLLSVWTLSWFRRQWARARVRTASPGSRASTPVIWQGRSGG